jgi:hypothetical protein
MLLAKSILLGLLLFVILLVVLLWFVTPKGAGFGQMMFSIEVVRRIVTIIGGCAAGLIIGSGVLFWLAQSLHARNLKMLTGAGN